MATTELMDKMVELANEMERCSKEFRSVMNDAAWAWPDYQMVKFGEWKSRDEVPPEGTLWASDGLRVWTIRSDGKGIPSSASAVKFWTAALVPSPPQAANP